MFRHAFLPMPSAVAPTVADAPKAAAGLLTAAPAIDVAVTAAAATTAPVAAAVQAAVAAGGARS
ncbi:MULTISPECIES: hypothetical protein [unclassified Streptomyces]|uniref:hypothetical protein n=1 Tax=unclassified Streptomyces TaxID=2593676 RepID=UPI00035FACAB|nr:MULTISPECIES: hypothetical protein [unclassified Streptomyces]MYT27356.1 hypothetical protein [Streptomyces sp. SID8354]